MKICGVLARDWEYLIVPHFDLDSTVRLYETCKAFQRDGIRIIIGRLKQRAFECFHTRHWNKFSPTSITRVVFPHPLAIHCRWSDKTVEFAVFSSPSRLYKALHTKLQRLRYISESDNCDRISTFKNGKNLIQVSGITKEQCNFILNLRKYQRIIEPISKI